MVFHAVVDCKELFTCPWTILPDKLVCCQSCIFKDILGKITNGDISGRKTGLIIPYWMADRFLDDLQSAE